MGRGRWGGAQSNTLIMGPCSFLCCFLHLTFHCFTQLLPFYQAEAPGLELTLEQLDSEKKTPCQNPALMAANRNLQPIKSFFVSPFLPPQPLEPRCAAPPPLFATTNTPKEGRSPCAKQSGQRSDAELLWCRAGATQRSKAEKSTREQTHLFGQGHDAAGSDQPSLLTAEHRARAGGHTRPI